MSADDNAFTRILNRLDESDTGVSEKTASHDVKVTTDARMLDIVRSISDVSTKTASDASRPSDQLDAMAKQAADAEYELLQKQSQLLGAALADGFMQRFAQYDSALSNESVKVASSLSQDSLTKAAEAGYRTAVADLEKRAADEYNQGYQDQMNAVHKTASEIHYAGQSVAHNLVTRMRQAAK